MTQDKGRKTKKTGEMRDSIRMPVYFPLSYALLSDREYQTLKNSFCLHRTSDREGVPSPLDEAIDIRIMERAMEESIGRPFVQMWQLINRKLDLIYATLSKGASLEWKGRATCVEIGGRGLKMRGNTGELKRNQWLKLRISPLTYPAFSIEAIGKAQRVGKKEDTPHGPLYTTAVQFDVINEDDRELLISYLFKRQREVIRSGHKNA